VGAALIDMLITVPIFIGLLFLQSPTLFLLGVVVLVAYKPLMEGLLGATVGKLALGLRVVDKETRPIGLVTALIRAALFIVSSLPAYISYYLMKAQGIAITDVAAMQAFQQSNRMLDYLGWGFGMLTFVACLMVAFTARKRGLHDMFADTLVVYKETLPRR
jgi:uncharacterized RDD family membrane protein YckC